MSTSTSSKTISIEPITSKVQTSTVQSIKPQSTITVDVGSFKDRNRTAVEFRPSHVCAPPGTLILFNMLTDVHSVTQSSFDHPCKHAGAFDTGLIFSADNTTSTHLEPYRIESSAPTWFFCKQTDHCQRGMVFAINPGSADQMVEFVSKAMYQGMESASASVSTVLNTSSSNNCMQALTTGAAGIGNLSSGTGFYPTGTGSTGHIPHPTGLGWNASNTRSFGRPPSPSATSRSSSAIFAELTRPSQIPALSVGNAFKPHALWFVISVFVAIININQRY